MTGTSDVPGPRLPDVELGQSAAPVEPVEVRHRAADGEQDAIDVDACRSGRTWRRSSVTPASNVRVDVTGRSVTVTVTSSPPSGTTPAGRSNPTMREKSLDAPLADTASVSARSSAASWSASPSTVT